MAGIYELYSERDVYCLTSCIPCCIYLPAGLFMFGLDRSGRLPRMHYDIQLWRCFQIALIVLGILTVLYVLFWILVAIGCPRGNGMSVHPRDVWSLASCRVSTWVVVMLD
jgi:uncharacterized membrane protein YhdT